MKKLREPHRFWLLGSAIRNIENQEDETQCEDAEPLIERLPDGRIFTCIADGLGGYTQGFDGKSGGFIASRTAVKTAFEFFCRDDAVIENDASALTNHIYKALRNIAEWKLPPSRVRGTLGRHRLATTLACAVFNDPGNVCETTINLYWIGDSRIYFLDAHGLSMLTCDDNVTHSDAYDSTFESPPMSQFLAASMERDWCINRQQFVADTPGVLILCSDGCTADWETPWKFELALQKALESSTGWNKWLQKFKIRLDRIRSDDVSLIAYPLHLSSFSRWKKLRKRQVDKSPAALAMQAGMEGMLSQKQIWKTIYQPVYEGKIPEAKRPGNQSGIIPSSEKPDLNSAEQSVGKTPNRYLMGIWIFGLISGVPVGMGLSSCLEQIGFWIKSLCPFI